MLLAAAPELPQLHVGEAVFLGPAQRLFELILAPALAQQLAEQRQFIGEGHQVLNLVQEPGVDHGELIDLVHAHPAPKGLAQVEQALGVGHPQFGPQLVRADLRQVLAVMAQAEAADLQRADALLQGLLEGAADGHDFAHRLHGGGEEVLGAGEFLEGPAGDLDHAVVDGGFEGGESLPGDIVVDFVQSEAHRQLGGDLGDGEAGGLGGQGRRARHPGVHLDDHHFAGLGVNGELDVGAAGLHPDLPDDGDGRVPHGLVFPVGQGLGRGHGDGVAGVHPHGVQVLDGADDHHVVLEVPHHFQLEFLPAQDRLFQHHLGDHAGVQALGGHELQVFQVVGDAAAGAAQGEAGADDDGVAEGRGRGHGLLQGADDGALGDSEVDVGHGVPEELPVFGLLDDVGVGPDHLHPQALQDAGVGHGDGAVEAGLAAQGGQDGVGALAFDHLADHLRGDGLDVGAVGHLRVGHDGGGVGIDQHHLVALLAEGLAGLGAGIVELAGLADDDGPRADDQDFLEVSPFRHNILEFLSFCVV